MMRKSVGLSFCRDSVRSTPASGEIAPFSTMRSHRIASDAQNEGLAEKLSEKCGGNARSREVECVYDVGAE